MRAGVAEQPRQRHGPETVRSEAAARADLSRRRGLAARRWRRDDLVDPYFSRPNLDGEIASDPKAVAARAPKTASLIVIGHSHVDHLLDAPAVALAAGAQIMGSDSTARVAVAAGVPADHVIPIKGGEDYQFVDYSVRVIPSLHSALDDKHTFGKPITAVPPRTFDKYQEGGTFDYLVRIADRQVLVTSTANFIERELRGRASRHRDHRDRLT